VNECKSLGGGGVVSAAAGAGAVERVLEIPPRVGQGEPDTVPGAPSRELARHHEVRDPRAARRGGAVQVDPIKPTLKPPGTERLNLKCDILLLNFAFKFNLRRYNEDDDGFVVREDYVADGALVRLRSYQSDPIKPINPLNRLK